MATRLDGFSTASTPRVLKDKVFFQGTDNKLWETSIANPTNQADPLGAYKASSSPCIGNDGNIYFQGTDNQLWQVSLSDPSTKNNLGGFKTASTPCVPGDGNIYFQGTNDQLWQTSIANPSNQNNPLSGYKTDSTPCVPGDGNIYFQGTDDKLWQVSLSNPSQKNNLGGFHTASTPVVVGGNIYFQGTNNQLWQTSIANPSNQNNPLSAYKTSSTPCVPNDGYIYFQGTDNTLWQVSLSSPSQKNNFGGLQTASTPCVPNDGNIYFQGAGGVEDELLCQAITLPFTPSDWMNNLMSASGSTFGQMSLKQIVIPGSHDAGMYHDSAGNSIAQNQTIYQQLMGGVRYFDLRVKTSGSGFKIDHGGASGPSLSDIVGHIQTFMSRSNCKEVAILKFRLGFDDDDTYQRFLEVLNPLSSWYYTAALPANTRLAQLALSTLVSDGKGKLLVVCNFSPQNANPPGIYKYADGSLACPQESRKANPTSGDLRVFDCYSNEDDCATMAQDQLQKFQAYNGYCTGSYSSVVCDLYLLSWTLTPTWPWSIWGVAQEANFALGGAISGFGPNSNGQMVNIIYLDYYEISDVTAICYDINSSNSSS